MLGDPEVMRWYGGGVIMSRDAVRAALAYHLHCRDFDYWAWAITSKIGGRFIGSLTADLTNFENEHWFEPAWIITRAEWGQGFATEAAREVVRYAIDEMQSTRLLATAHPDNRASIRVIEKPDFTFVRQAEVRKGRPAVVFVIQS
jgi:ribosomal-protein-alanine N-acetyltransferase